MVCPDDELADVDLPVRPADVRDDNVQPGPVGQGGVDERAAQVDPPPAALQHPLDEVAHVVGGEDGGRQLGDPASCDEDLARLVDPDLLDGRVVEVLLQRPVARDDGEDRVHRRSHVSQRRQASVQRPLVIVLDRVLDETADLEGVARGVDA